MKKLIACSLLAAGLAVLAGGRPALADKARRVKMATLVPDGSVWHKILQDMKADWDTETEGRVNLVIYPGGVAGDEPDVVRKMRIGQIQAASFTSKGFVNIDSYFQVFTIPLFYESYDELHYVMRQLEPMLVKRMDAKGFVLLNWGAGGWVYVYSTKPARTVEDLRRLKMFTWAGSEHMAGFWKKNGFRPVELAATDIMTGLQTGMIEAMLTTPLASLSLQWFRQTPYMLDVPLTPLMGGNVINKNAWEAISEADRATLVQVCRKAEGRAFVDIPKQDLAAVEEMKKRGLQVISPGPGDTKAFTDIAKDFASGMREVEVPEEAFDAAVKARDEYRSRKAAGGNP